MNENPVAQNTTSLAEAGSDKNLAHRAPTLAAMPEEKFEEPLDEKRRREYRGVVLDPELRAKADAADNHIITSDTAEACIFSGSSYEGGGCKRPIG